VIPDERNAAVGRALHSETDEPMDIVLVGDRLVAYRSAGTGRTWLDPDAARLPGEDLAGPWRHYKGGRYVVHGVVSTRDGGVLVLYRDTHEAWWLRPLGMWSEHVERDGCSGPRFVRDALDPS
jgi:hypothetical protein